MVGTVLSFGWSKWISRRTLAGEQLHDDSMAKLCEEDEVFNVDDNDEGDFCGGSGEGKSARSFRFFPSFLFYIFNSTHDR
ncbi:hypothetical protein ACLOJK_004055 [Asimina triloba]